jgi:hypothetical protein
LKRDNPWKNKLLRLFLFLGGFEMKLFSERYKDVESFPLVTYSEVVEVKKGFTEAKDPNTINILKSRKWGFVEVKESKEPVVREEPKKVSTKDEIPKSEEAPEKPVLEPESPSKPKAETKPKAKKGKPKASNKVKAKAKPNTALSESDVNPLTGRH